MKKTLSLLLALVMVIGLFPVFADEAPALTAEEAGAVLQGYGAIKGDSNGDLMIDKELKRQDAVVILTRLMGKDKEVEAMPKETKASFEDITIDYYQPFLAFAESNKWIEGKAEKIFGFNDVVTVKEFSAMLLRALGHDTMGENYAKVMDLAKEQGLFKGAMVDENANLVRGIAFILMNNTLETAPKGEDKALVYKLGYKEEPKPENLTVVSAEAAGLKAIDVKFSKAVSEKSLAKGISVKDGSNKVTFEVSLMDEMTARLVLNAVAKQDAKYTVTVDGVKSADMMEAVEKYEAAVFMTDQVRPEVLSVEALNPKTLLIKVSEPIDFDKPGFATLANFKIDGKALVARATSDLEKNEVLVELYTALKAGDYKIEVSSLKDFAGFIAKTAEFDVTVVEDKDAPVATEATMVNLKTIKVMFNEPLSQKGQFKVNGENVASSVLEKDKKTVTLTLQTGKELGMSAVVEVKVEYKGQKDIMANEVKDWTKLTFKVEDDTTLPEVKSVELDKTDIVVTFTKNMDTAKGSFTLKKGNETKIAKQAVGTLAKFKADDAAVLVIDAKSVLNNAQAANYTLILEGFIDGTVRKNEMAKVEQTVAAGDTEAPQVLGSKQTRAKVGDQLVVEIYFNEEMDEATLLEGKNYTLKTITLDDGTTSDKRADQANVTLKAENAGKTLVITTNDKNVKSIAEVHIVGLKDKAGNMLNKNVTLAAVGTVAAQTSDAKFMKKDGKFVIEVKFDNPIAYMGDTYKLLGKGDKDLNLTLIETSADNKTFVYSFDQDKVTSDKKHDGEELEFELINGGKNAQDIFGQDAKAPSSFEDKAAPALMKDKDNKPVVTFKDDYTQIKVSFDEEVDPATTNVVLTDEDGASVNLAGLAVDTDKSILIIEKNDSSQFKNGTYKLTLQKVTDSVLAGANSTTELGTIDVKVAAPTAEVEGLKDVPLKDQNKIVLKLKSNITKAKFKGGENAVSVANDLKVTIDGTTDNAVTALAFATAGEIELTLTDNLTANQKVKITYVDKGKLVDDINATVSVPAFTISEFTIAD